MQNAAPLKIALVSMHIQKSSRAVPLGAAMIASSVKTAIPDIAQPFLIDLYLDQTVDESVDMILKTDPDCVGFSVYLWNRMQILLIARALKKIKSELVVFAGGPEPTASSSDFKTDGCGNFDFILGGEGENISVEAVRILAGGALPGDNRALLPVSPDELPSPYLDGTLDVRLYPGLLWELSRGCPFKCDFCFESRGYNTVRMFPREKIQRELELFASSGVKEIFILDPTFNHNKRRAKDLLVMMQNTAPEIHYNIEVRSEYLDREMAELFSCLKCSLQIGMQSAHKAVLANINRTINKKDFEKKVLYLHEAGVTYGFDLIYGLPGDTLSGFLESLDFALGMVPNHIDIFPLAVLPGTRLFETADALGLEYQKKDPYLVFSSPAFPESDLRQAEKTASAFDLFYNKGCAVPWLSLLLENTGLNPSLFFAELAIWISETGRSRLSTKGSEPFSGEIQDCCDLTIENIIRLQQDYIGYLFEKENIQPLTGIMKDIIQYFGLYALMEESDADSAEGWFLYSPSELERNLHNGIRDLGELAFFVPVLNSTVLFKKEYSQITITE